MNHDEITEQILGVWSEEAGDVVDQPEEVDTEEAANEAELEETPAEEPETEEPEEDTDEEEDESGEAEIEEDEELQPTFETDDPEVRAFLARYQDDLEKALKGAVELTRTLNRQGQEKNAALRRAQELETELQNRRAMDNTTAYLNEEQRNWVQEAAESGSPRNYVQAAVREGEFQLARAVCEAWADVSPYEAARTAAQVDQAEQVAREQYFAQQPEPVVDHPALMEVLVQHFPDMPSYEEQMVGALVALGPGHPLAEDARSNDPETAARGIIGIYEIARASTATVKQTREQLKQRRQAAADEARANGVVSSATATPTPTEKPRSQRQLGPGLTLEQLDEAFDAQ